MKKISVFLALVMVLASFAFITVQAADSVPVLVYEPATKTYTPGDNVEMKTVAKGNNLKFSWLVVVSTDTQDYTFDFSKEAGVMNFQAFDPTGKMKVKMSVSGVSDGKTTATLTFENIAMFDYGIFVTCTVANSAGSKDTDKAALYPSTSAPPVPEIEMISELDVRIGKLIKLACNVYMPEGFEYDNIEYVWYTTPDGDKSNAEKIDDEENSVLVVDTGAGGIYFYYCSIYIQKGVNSYYYESAVTMIRVHEPVMEVTYSAVNYELTPGETAEIKAIVKFENSDEKGNLSYQWMSGDNNIPGTYTAVKGGTSDTLKVTGADKAGKKYYCCIVTNEIDGYKFSSDSSDITIVTVNSIGAKNPVVHMDPKDAYANVGETVTFTVDAENAVAYEWYMVKPGGTTNNPNTPKKLKNGSDGVISGADTAIIKIKASAENNGCTFYCQVYGTNGKYVSTKNAKLTVHLPMPKDPVIKKQPESVSVKTGEKATLSVTAESPDGGTLRYQWYFSSKPEYPLIRAVFDAEDKTFTPDQEDEETYYCVAVWNILNGEESNPVYSAFAKVVITDKGIETVTEENTETETESLTSEETEDTAIAGDETTVENDTDESVTEQTGETAAETAETEEPAAETAAEEAQTSNKTVIILLVVIICLLAAALIGVIVFLIIKFVVKQ